LDLYPQVDWTTVCPISAVPYQISFSNYVNTGSATAIPAVFSGDHGGDAYAQSWVGHAYEEGMGVGRNLSRALKWHLAAAEQDEPFSQNGLGWAFYYGKGARRSNNKSFYWFRKATLIGDALGQYKVGNAYAEGSGLQ
jgi:TPR repeat protein